MYHNELCNFSDDFLLNKKCDRTCENWNTCTRKNSYEWEQFLKGVDVSINTSGIQHQRMMINRERFRKDKLLASLLRDIEDVNERLRRMNHDSI